MLLIDDIMTIEVPEILKRQRTLFDIAKFPSYENVISNWYAYFLDPEEDHGLQDLFIQSLLAIVNTKTGRNFTIDQCYIKREVVTKTNKRIDIVIYGSGSEFEKQIIIENKINFWLHNDLFDYWNHKDTGDHQKLGIVLSLKKEGIPLNVQGKFINILHGEFIKEVQKNFKLDTLTERQQFLFKEFIAAIINLTKDVIMNKQVQFYFENSELVDRAIATKKNATDFIFNQIKIAADQLGAVMEGLNDNYRWILIANERRVHYTIITNSLWENKKQIGIIIELNAEGCKKLDVLNKEILPINPQLGFSSSSPTNKYYNHYLSKYYMLQEDDLDNLAGFIKEKIENDFEAVMLKIMEIVKR